MISSIWSRQTSSSVCCPMMMSHCMEHHTCAAVTILGVGGEGDMEPVCPDQAHIAQGQVVTNTNTTNNVCRYNPTLHCTVPLFHQAISS